MVCNCQIGSLQNVLPIFLKLEFCMLINSERETSFLDAVF